jgi:predicted Rossmann-fold nucleotide-binding protein
VPMFPVVLYDSTHWAELVDWLSERLVAGGMISPADTELFHVTDDPAQAVEIVVAAYERREAAEAAPS